jgi:hypothetical protein
LQAGRAVKGPVFAEVPQWEEEKEDCAAITGVIKARGLMYQNLPLIRERRIEMIAKTNSICTSSPNEKRKNPSNHPITRITAIT